MPSFGPISKSRLATCHSDLQVLCNELIKEYDFTVVCGHRDEADQNKAYREGKSQKQFPNSTHNYKPSLAVDLAPYEKNGIDWGKTQSAYFAGRVMQKASDLFQQGKMKHHIRCGIDWNMNNDVDDTTFWDAGHFEVMPN